MMHTWPDILAQGDSDLPKIIFGIIFLLIWALSALVSWINKQQQEEKRRRVRDQLEQAARYGQPVRSRVPPPPPMPIPPQQRGRPAARRIAEGLAQRFPEVTLPPAPPPPLPVPQQRRPAPPMPPARRVTKQPQPRRAISPAAAPVVLEEIAPPPAQPYVNVTQPAPRAKPPTVNAAALHQWMTPATLRQQFILTEILQPPLALRPNEHGRA